jgi:hypothetical protein
MALLVPTGTLRNEHTGPLHECSVGFFQAPSMSSHRARPRVVTTPLSFLPFAISRSRNSEVCSARTPPSQLAIPEFAKWPDLAISQFGVLEVKPSVLPTCETQDHDVDQWSRSACSRWSRSNRDFTIQRFENQDLHPSSSRDPRSRCGPMVQIHLCSTVQIKSPSRDSEV